jgi:hypothetical protein
MLTSGCSKHMKGNKDKFLDLKKQKGKVTFGDNASSNILGKGIVSLGKDKARNVLLVDKLKPSLLSVSQTCDRDTSASLIPKNVRLGKKTHEN